MIQIDPTRPRRSDLKKVCRVIQNGGLIAYPTDTFYGLAVNPFDEGALDRLFRIKGRSDSKPIALLISGREMLPTLVREISPLAQRVMDRFWPGPLTLVFSANESLPERLTARTGTIGIRFPRAAIPLALIQETGFPLTATSANRSGASPSVSARETEKVFGPALDFVLDGGVCETCPSTLLDVTGTCPKMLRAGRVTTEVLKAFFNEGKKPED